MADSVYTDADSITQLLGRLGLDLRTDDDDPDTLVAEAIDHASGQVDFYCSRYAQAELAANQWVRGVATLLAVRWLCLHRLNDVPKGVEAAWQEYKGQLDQVLKGEAPVPRAAHSRRPVTVTNSHVDNRRFNNQVRVDRSRSTGVAKDYRRPADPGAPDQR